MINYKKDVLLTNKRVNIYSALVKYDDLKDKNFGLRTPVLKILDTKEIIQLTKEKFGNFDKGLLIFIKNLEIYLGIKFVSLYKAKYRYLQLFKKKKINLIFLRVISLSLSKNERDSIKMFNRLTKNKIKIDNLEINVKKINVMSSYLAGVICGDGHLDKREREIIISDGQTDKEKLKLSRKFFKILNKIFKKEFNITGTIDRKKNWYNLRISNKWLLRFFNCYFEIPLGRKCDIIKLPSIISRKNERFFWRGLMDTDGCAKEQSKGLTVKSNSSRIIEEFKNFCDKNKINSNIKMQGKKAATLIIFVDSFLKYAQIIGFNHPRKKNTLINYLKDGPKYKVLKKLNINSPEMVDLFKLLRPYKESVYIKLDEFNQKAKKSNIKKMLGKMERIFQIKISKVKRKRYNSQYNIYSKKFVEFINANAKYGLPWKTLNKFEIENLEKKWKM